MIIVSRFDSVWDEKRQGFVIVGTENIPCPDCEGDLKPYDTCKRHVTHLDDEEVGHRVLYVLRRLQCENCKKTHRELPNFIVPYKHPTKKGPGKNSGPGSKEPKSTLRVFGSSKHNL